MEIEITEVSYRLRRRGGHIRDVVSWPQFKHRVLIIEHAAHQKLLCGMFAGVVG
jgi:hypothetical protein